MPANPESDLIAEPGCVHDGVLSILLGLWFAFAAGLGLGWTERLFALAFIAIPCGALPGLLVMPATAFFFRNRPTVSEQWLVIGITTATAFAACAAWRHLTFSGAILLTIACYTVLCVKVGMLALKRRGWSRDWNTCRRCGYSLIGLKSGICPECGSAV